jgi:hypothetical protein
MVVVDGLQRLSTFKRFLANDFRLKLPKQPDLNKKLFKELSPKLQNRIEDCNLILYIIDSKVPERARLDIFERVNSGEVLTRQQMRNCLYSGKATRFLKVEASKSLFKSATGNSLKSKTMRDRECVNRFCAFHLLPLYDANGSTLYKGDMDEWLAEALNRMNKLDDTELSEMSNKLKVALLNNQHLFREQAFRKHIPEQTKRGVLNVSLWDVMTVGLENYSLSQVKLHEKALRENFYDLLNDKQFVDSITLGTNSSSSVTNRFKAVNKMLMEILDA